MRIGPGGKRGAVRFFVVRALANNRAGRAIGVGDNFEPFGAVPAARLDVAAMSGAADVTAQRANVPTLRDARKQQQRDGKSLQSAGPLREPGAR